MIKKCLALLFLTLLTNACATERVSGTPPLSDRIIAAPAGASEEGRTMYLFALARLRATEGDHDGALVLLREAIAVDPASAFLHTAAAQIHLQQSRPEEALAECQTAIKIEPSFLQAQALCGNILMAMQREKEAIPYYKKVMELDPTKEDVYLHVAIFYLKNFEYEQAVDTLKAMVKAAPESALGYYYLAKTYDQMRLPREAVTYYKKALDLKPDFEQALIEMGISQETQGLLGDAIESYKGLLEINQANANVIQHLAQLYIQQKRLEEALALLQEKGGKTLENSRKIGLLLLELERYDEAVNTFQEILSAEPGAQQVRFYLATAYEEKEAADLAIAEFQKIPKDSPYYLDAIGHLAYLYKEKGDPAKGVALLQEEIKQQPTKIEAYLHLAGFYESMERYRDGLDVLKTMDQKLQGDPRVLFRLGILHDKLGQKALSVSMMKRVLAAAPNDAQALNYLGYTYAEMGVNLDEALAYLKKAVELKPDDGFILDSLGWTYYKMKRYNEAITQLERAAQLSDGDATVIGHLADAYCATRSFKKALPLYKKLQKMEPEQTAELADKIKRCRLESGEK